MNCGCGRDAAMIDRRRWPATVAACAVRSLAPTMVTRPAIRRTFAHFARARLSQRTIYLGRIDVPVAAAAVTHHSRAGA